MIKEYDSNYNIISNTKGFFRNPKNICFFLSFLIAFLSFGTKGSFFYASWIIEVIILILYIFHVSRKGGILKINCKVSLTMSMWMAYCIILPIVTPIVDLQMHIKIILISFFYTIISVIICDNIFRSSQRFYGTMYYFSLCWTVISCITFVLFMSGITLFPNKRNFSGIFWDRNVFSMITLFFNTFLLFNKNFFLNKMKKKALFMFILNSIFILFSLSFTGFIGLSLILFIYVIGFTRNVKKIGITILLMISLIGIFFTENPLKHRVERFTLVFTDPTQLNDSESAFGRVYLMKQSLHYISENFWTGVGVNNSRYYITRGDFADKGTFSHNNYLESMLNGGIINFILFYIPIIQIVTFLVKNRKVIFQKNKYEYKIYIYILALLFLKLLFDFTWVGYFEFGLVFIYVYLYYYTISFKAGFSGPFEQSFTK